MSQATGPSYPIESVERALRLLVEFESVDSVMIPEAAELLGVSRSTAFRLLNVLQYHHFVEQDPRTKAYRGGPVLKRIGLAVVRNLELGANLRPLLQRIVDAVGETAHIVVLQGADVLFLDSVESPKVLRTASRTGTALPAYCTAGGKALLARLSPDQLQRALPKGRLKSLTSHSVTSRRELLAELDEAREHGYAVNRGESEDGVNAVGVAIGEDGQNGMDLAVTLSGPDRNLGETTLEEIALTARRLIDEASVGVGR
jgi:IclR family acetate operon transcriptional repressor